MIKKILDLTLNERDVKLIANELSKFFNNIISKEQIKDILELTPCNIPSAVILPTLVKTAQWLSEAAVLEICKVALEFKDKPELLNVMGIIGRIGQMEDQKAIPDLKQFKSKSTDERRLIENEAVLMVCKVALGFKDKPELPGVIGVIEKIALVIGDEDGIFTICNFAIKFKDNPKVLKEVMDKIKTITDVDDTMYEDLSRRGEFIALEEMNQLQGIIKLAVIGKLNKTLREMQKEYDIPAEFRFFDF
ncbi:MAG: hypothetical protein AB1391_04385 [Candidatus Micrarchaeota archaeon]